jgi:hypothetical protein
MLTKVESFFGGVVNLLMDCESTLSVFVSSRRSLIIYFSQQTGWKSKESRQNRSRQYYNGTPGGSLLCCHVVDVLCS